jgi:hypothetical protein
VSLLMIDMASATETLFLVQGMVALSKRWNVPSSLSGFEFSTPAEEPRPQALPLEMENHRWSIKPAPKSRQETVSEIDQLRTGRLDRVSKLSNGLNDHLLPFPSPPCLTPAKPCRRYSAHKAKDSDLYAVQCGVHFHTSI